MHISGSIELNTLTIEKNLFFSQNLSIGDAHVGQNDARSGKKGQRLSLSALESMD